MATVKHVAIVGPLPPPAGGMANQTEQLCQFLKNEGLNVTVVQVNPPYSPQWIGKLPMFRAFIRLVQYRAKLKQDLAHVDVVHIMANSGWSWHLFAAPAIRIARSLNKRIVLNYRGGYAGEFFAKSWDRVKKSLDLVDEIIVPSTFLQEVFSQYGKSSTVIPNVLNVQRFNSDDRIASMKPCIIVTRNLEEIYDVASAIHVFAAIKAKFPDAELKVAGTGPERENLEKLVLQLGVSSAVDFVGRLTPEDIAKLYKAADLMLNTSVVDNSPNSLIESLACGTPVVSTNVGGIPKLVTDKHDALLSNPKDVSKMTEQALQVLSDDSLRVKLTSNGLQTVEKFFWPKIWKDLNACYDDKGNGANDVK